MFWKLQLNLKYLISKKLENKHILLVDDVITTGNTVELCYNELNQIPNIKLSLATMAFVN